MIITLQSIQQANAEAINSAIQSVLHEKCEHCEGKGTVMPQGSNMQHMCSFCMGKGGLDFAGDYSVLQPLIETEYAPIFQASLKWILGTDDLHKWLTATTLNKAKAWLLSKRACVRPFKRNHWTNEEVIELLKGQKITQDIDRKVPGDDIIFTNLILDEAVDMFYDFMRDDKEFGAMAYHVEKKEVMHVGNIPPE